MRKLFNSFIRVIQNSVTIKIERQSTHERRQFYHLDISIGYFKLTVFKMRGNLKIQFTFNNWLDK